MVQEIATIVHISTVVAAHNEADEINMGEYTVNIFPQLLLFCVYDNCMILQYIPEPGPGE